MDYRLILSSQYQASLEMLKQTIVHCPQSIWNSHDDKTKFWHIAYHKLRFLHLYLQDSEAAFTPWPQHREGYQSLSTQSLGEAYDKETILDYLAFCQQQVAEKVPQLNLEAASGFSWLPFTKFELQLYSLRHTNQHLGELMDRLGTRANIAVAWVGTKYT